MTNTELRQIICTLSPDDLEQSGFFDGFMCADRKLNYFTNPKIKLGGFPNTIKVLQMQCSTYFCPWRGTGGGGRGVRGGGDWVEKYFPTTVATNQENG